MRASSLQLVLALTLLVPGVASAQYGPRYRMPYDPSYQRWDQPVDGSTPSTPAQPEPEPLVTYGTIELGQLTTGNLVENETHYLQFKVTAPSHCMLESEDPSGALQIAYLDETTRVAAVGLYAELKAGSYFVRLRSRGKAGYKLTLQCSAQ